MVGAREDKKKVAKKKAKKKVTKKKAKKKVAKKKAKKKKWESQPPIHVGFIIIEYIAKTTCLVVHFNKVFEMEVFWENKNKTIKTVLETESRCR